MAGLLGNIGAALGGLLGSPRAKDALLLSIASGGDPRFAAGLMGQRNEMQRANKQDELYQLKMEEARRKADEARLAQKRQETTQGLLTTLNIPQVREAYSTPDMQAVLRPYVVANADPAALEQAGLLAPIPTAQEEPSIVRTIRAMGGDPQDPKWQAVIMQSLVKPQTSINMGAQFPDLPKDHMWVNPMNPAEGVKVIPNSPTDVAQRAEADQGRVGATATLSKISNIMDSLNQAIPAVGAFTAGTLGSVASVVPGTSARDLSGALTTIKANIGFQELQAMREASPTGGALGQVAVQELESLQAALASLDQGQSPARLAENLRRVQTHYQNWRKTVEAARGGTNVVPNSSPSQGAPASKPVSEWTYEELQAELRRLESGQ